MEIIVGKTAGFCFGVQNAVSKTEEELKNSKQVYCLGELVHNTQVTETLKEKGAIFIDNIEEAKEKVIIRAHGIPKNVYKKAEEKKIHIIDLTCPKVLQIHKIAEEYAKLGYFIAITGKAEHPETVGTVSFCGDNYFVIEQEQDIQQVIQKFEESKASNLLVISQTTYNIEKFNNIIKTIKERVKEENLVIKNTICSATKERQEETKEIAARVQTMIIVGSKHSSNSTKLYDLASKVCENVIFIETEQELDINSLKEKKTIGIMAGASTPQISIKKVIEKLSNM